MGPSHGNGTVPENFVDRYNGLEYMQLGRAGPADDNSFVVDGLLRVFSNGSVIARYLVTFPFSIMDV